MYKQSSTHPAHQRGGGYTINRRPKRILFFKEKSFKTNFNMYTHLKLLWDMDGLYVFLSRHFSSRSLTICAKKKSELSDAGIDSIGELEEFSLPHEQR
jgi:hypothetical protein